MGRWKEERGEGERKRKREMGGRDRSMDRLICEWISE